MLMQCGTDLLVFAELVGHGQYALLSG
jgi:hypothetical protein